MTPLSMMLEDGQQDWPENNRIKTMVVSSTDTWNCFSVHILTITFCLYILSLAVYVPTSNW